MDNLLPLVSQPKEGSGTYYDWMVQVPIADLPNILEKLYAVVGILAAVVVILHKSMRITLY